MSKIAVNPAKLSRLLGEILALSMISLFRVSPSLTRPGILAVFYLDSWQCSPSPLMKAIISALSSDWAVTSLRLLKAQCTLITDLVTLWLLHADASRLRPKETHSSVLKKKKNKKSRGTIKDKRILHKSPACRYLTGVHWRYIELSLILKIPKFNSQQYFKRYKKNLAGLNH